MTCPITATGAHSDGCYVDHEYTDELTCPQCGHEWSDSWELNSSEGNFGEDLGEQVCDECGCEFYATRNISVSYSTRVITAEDRAREQRQRERQQADMERMRLWWFRRLAWRRLGGGR